MSIQINNSLHGDTIGYCFAGEKNNKSYIIVLYINSFINIQ